VRFARKGPYIPAFARIWCRHAVGVPLSIQREHRTLAERFDEAKHFVFVARQIEKNSAARLVAHRRSMVIVGRIVTAT